MNIYIYIYIYIYIIFDLGIISVSCNEMKITKVSKFRTDNFIDQHSKFAQFCNFYLVLKCRIDSLSRNADNLPIGCFDRHFDLVHL